MIVLTILYLSVRPSGLCFKFSAVDLKHSTHFTGILKKESYSVYLFKDRLDRVMVLDSAVCLCVLIWVTTGQMPAVVAADKECVFYGTPEGTFPFRYYQKRNGNKEIRTEIETKNISFNRLIISFKRYKIEWKLKQENQNGS